MENSSSSNNETNNNNNNKGKQLWRRVQQFWMTRWTRWYTWYRGLSKRAKRLVTVQLLVASLLLGSVTRSVVARQAAAPPPVEIAYSTFLDLVEQQQQSNENIPILDHVRIGPDRISYRLYKRGGEEEASDPKTKQKTTTTAPTQLRAFTRKVPASPELIHTLRDNKITFAALPQPRASAVATMTRTLMIGFYFLILWRLYGTMARANGSGKGDTPGKLAQSGDLPMASFDDIQGIDGAKTEVMELVDALRNPDKYAILGARAPTGLLLEGPVRGNDCLVILNCFFFFNGTSHFYFFCYYGVFLASPIHP